MRTPFYLTFFAVLATSLTFAQNIAGNTIGLRLGDSKGFGAEVSYQRGLNRTTRLEANLGWRENTNFNAVKLTATHQHVFEIDSGLNWYYGYGLGVGNARFEFISNPNNPNQTYRPDGGIFGLITGDVGIEYGFDFPLLISLDFRPEIGVFGYDNFKDNFDFDVGLGLRYYF